MRVISPTSIQPRFGELGPRLEGLPRQGADRVVLALPEPFRRFPGPVAAPALPWGMTLLQCAEDHGPLTKLLLALEAFPETQIALCDNACLCAPGRLSAFCAARAPGMAVAGSV